MYHLTQNNIESITSVSIKLVLEEELQLIYLCFLIASLLHHITKR